MSKQEVNRALSHIDKLVQIVLDETAQGITDEAKRRCVTGTYKTGQVGGRLKGSISWSDESRTHMYEKKGQDTGATDSDKIGKTPSRDIRYIGTNVDYAAHVEFGTSPHKIEVKTASVLSDGSNFFGRVVNHPGTSPIPFMRPALKQARRIVKQVAKRHGISGTIK